MLQRRVELLVERYTRALVRRHGVVLVVGALLAVAGVALASRLTLCTSISEMLPASTRSVHALHELEARRPATAIIEIGVASPDPAVTARFTDDLAAALRARAPRTLVDHLDVGDGEMRRFVAAHRGLYASLDDLRQARDLLARRADRDAARANPLLVDLDDDAGDDDADRKALDGLEARLAKVRASLDGDGAFVAEGGKLRMIVCACPFPDTDAGHTLATLELVDAEVQRLDPRRYDARLEVGYVGAPVTTAYEHRHVIHDVGRSTVITLLLVAAVLLLVLRSARVVGALCVALVVGCAVTFGLTELLVGHLNTSTAFLASIVAGNGINFGVIVAARYLEARRAGRAVEPAIASALARAWGPTLVAALAAASAYLALVVTRFRGFSEFGVIAGMGMVACWLASVSVLPATLALVDRAAVAPRPSRTPRFTLRAPLVVALLASATLSGLAVIGVRSLYHDPFEDNLRNLASRSFPTSVEGRWAKRLDAAFGHDQSGGFYFAVERVDDVPVLVKALAHADDGKPDAQRILGRVDSILTVLPGTPDEQAQKIALLDEIAHLAARVRPQLDAGSEDARLLDEFVPVGAPSPKALGPDDLPAPLRAKITERDGRVGLLVAVRPAAGFPDWSLAGVRGADALLHHLDVPERLARTLVVSGTSLVFVDVMDAVRRDGPLATALAFLLAAALVSVGFRGLRDTALVLGALAAGVGAMLGAMALFGVRLDFLDFVAIPITVGIGVDYPFNVMARQREERAAGVGGPSWRAGLRETGIAVALCSATTTLGYLTLLSSDTGIIRSFGTAAVLGEITCSTAAIATVPALVMLFERRRRRRECEPAVAEQA